MNIGRILLGGVIAGLVINVVEWVVHGLLLKERWEQAMKELGRGAFGVRAIILFWIVGFAYGIALAWLYAMIRPRYGAGPKTAIWAGLYLWLVASLLVVVSFSPMRLWPTNLTIIAVIVSLVEFLVAGLVAGYLYREAEAAA